MERQNTLETWTPQTSIMSDFSACFKVNTESVFECDDQSFDNFNAEKISNSENLCAVLGCLNKDFLIDSYNLE